MTKQAKKTVEATKTPANTEGTIDLAKYSSLPTKSAKIRAMHADGHKRSMIATALQIRYQHVRNVLVEPLKKQG